MGWGILAGAMGGLGKGISDYAQFQMKEDAEDRRFERQNAAADARIQKEADVKLQGAKDIAEWQDGRTREVNKGVATSVEAMRQDFIAQNKRAPTETEYLDFKRKAYGDVGKDTAALDAEAGRLYDRQQNRENNLNIAKLQIDGRRDVAGLIHAITGGGTGKEPSEVATAKWIMANKDNPEAMAAFEQVKTLRTKNVDDAIADLAGKYSSNPAIKDPFAKATKDIRTLRGLSFGDDTPKPSATGVDMDTILKGGWGSRK